MFSKEMLEYLHDSRQMPDWAYYQQNGKILDKNYRAIVNREQRRFREEIELQEYKARREKEIEEELEKEAEEKLSITLNKLLDNLLKDFQ